MSKLPRCGMLWKVLAGNGSPSQRALALLLIAGLASANGFADEGRSEKVAFERSSDLFIESYALGVGEYETDDFTTVTGWRFRDHWHLGYQDGEDSGISLVWQNSRDQMSFSHNGIRFTRRF